MNKKFLSSIKLRNTQIIPKEVTFFMIENVYGIIDYINDNIRFGSKLGSDEIEKLFENYILSDEEKQSVYNELESLSIEIIYKKESLNEKISKLLIYIGTNKDIRESFLNEWFYSEKIDCDLQKVIHKTLKNLGYLIINDKDKEFELSDLTFLDEFEFVDLDSILDDDSFNEEVIKMKDSVDKSHNLDYLVDFHSHHVSLEKKEDAINNLINANHRLVWKLVLRYQKFSTVSFDKDDMYQVGMQGLMKAIELFDTNKGNQFSTYATWWIRQSITRGIANCSTTIRIPVHVREKIIKCIQVENQFWNEYGRVASREELACILELQPNQVSDLQKYRDVANLTSLETPVGAEDEGGLLGDFISDDKHQLPEEYAEDIVLKEEIQEIFAERLTPKESRILNIRFGLTDGCTHTLEEIGNIENVTRERIRQIEIKAIKKLQSTKFLERLKGFYYDKE